MHVQLRVVVPAGVLRERRDHPLMRVHVPARALTVVTRPAVTGLALQVLQHRLVPGHDRVPHHLRPPRPLPRLARPAGFSGLLGPDLQRRVQQADRLGHRERRVEEIHRSALVLQRLHDDLVPALLGRLGLGREQPGDPPGDLLVVAGEPARRPPERRLARRIPRISERPVEPLHHLVVHLRANRQAQLGAPAAGPDPRRLALLRDRGQVVVLPPGRHRAREVPRVIAAGYRQHHAPFPPITGSAGTAIIIVMQRCEGKRDENYLKRIAGGQAGGLSTSVQC